jgi:hypothetical protein
MNYIVGHCGAGMLDPAKRLTVDPMMALREE